MIICEDEHPIFFDKICLIEINDSATAVIIESIVAIVELWEYFLWYYVL